MLSEIKNNYKNVFAHFNFNSAECNKQKLIEIAKNGEKRPTRKNPLGTLLTNYICKSSSSYDPIFANQIKKLRPDWFDRTIQSRKNKQELIHMGNNLKKRPSCKSLLGRVLASYVCKSSNSYDPIFAEEIKKLRPDWFDLGPGKCWLPEHILNIYE